jgi:hypothetical protein
MAPSREPAWGIPRDVLLSGAVAGLARAGIARSCDAALRRQVVACSAAEARLGVVPPSAVVVPSRLMTFGKDVAAGTVAGMAVVAVGHPFDTLKVLLQTQPADKPMYTGVVDAFKVRATRPAWGSVTRTRPGRPGAGGQHNRRGATSNGTASLSRSQPALS